MKLIFIDVETGGLDPKNSALLQLSGMIVIDNRSMDSFNYFLKPFPADTVAPQALAVNNFSESELFANDSRFKDPRLVYKEFTALLGKYVNKFDRADKFFFVGYNSHAFDSAFLREFFYKNNDKYYGSWFFNPSIDVMLMAAYRLMGRRSKMPDFKLATVANELGILIDPTMLHDAMYDIELTRQMYDKLL